MDLLNKATADLKGAIDDYLYSRDDLHTDEELIALADEMIVKMLAYMRVVIGLVVIQDEVIEESYNDEKRILC